MADNMPAALVQPALPPLLPSLNKNWHRHDEALAPGKEV